MSENRLSRIEAGIEHIVANMATKADLEAAIAAVRAEMATKVDIEGVAKNVDVTVLGQLVRQLTNDHHALKDEIAVLSARIQQVIGLVSGFGDLLQALANQQSRLGERVRDLETREP